MFRRVEPFLWAGLALVALFILIGCSAASGPHPAPAAEMAPPPVSVNTTSAAAKATPLPTDATARMVVHNAQLVLEVTDVNATLQKIHDLAGAYGGYVLTTSVRDAAGAANQTRADVTITVRADSYDRAMTALRALAVHVDSESSSTQDVTDQYVDVSANLRNLQASEDALVKLMNRATNVNDVVTVQRELTNVRGQIQRLQAQQHLLEQQTALSTIQISLRPVPVAIAGMPDWYPLQTVARGWNASLAILRGLVEALLFGFSAGWWLIALVALGLKIWQRRRPTRPVEVKTPSTSGGS